MYVCGGREEGAEEVWVAKEAEERGSRENVSGRARLESNGSIVQSEGESRECL